MGRARGHDSTVTADRFAVLMGERRGFVGDRSLAADVPSPAARHEAELLAAQVADGVIMGVLQALRAHKKTLEAPLLAGLRAQAVAQLCDEACRLWTPAGADFVHTVAGDGCSDHIVLDEDDNTTLHLWPQGEQYAQPTDAVARASTTACGLLLGSGDYARVPRGWWSGPRTATARSARP